MGFKFTVVTSVPVTDTHTIKLEATRFNPNTGEGKISRTMVENFLIAWGGVNIAVADNAVTFDIKILDAIMTKKFWNQQRIDDLFLSEKSYVPATGVHRVEVAYALRDFPGVPAGPDNDAVTPEQQRQNFIKSLQVNATLITDDPINKIAVLETTRAKVRDAFMDEVRQRVESITVKRRRWVVAEVLMDQIEAAGGISIINHATYNGALIDRTTV